MHYKIDNQLPPLMKLDLCLSINSVVEFVWSTLVKNVPSEHKSQCTSVDCFCRDKVQGRARNRTGHRQ